MSLTAVQPRFVSDLRELGHETWSICASAFMADIALGAMTSTFSVHAKACGLDPVSIGTLVSAGGLVQLGATVPVGLLSDRVGRKRVIGAGHGFFAVSMALLAFAGTFWPLMVGRLLFALGSVSVFQTGSARLGDITPPRLRHTAFGLLSTLMGFGFGVGPFLGGILTDRLGHKVTYLFVSLVAACALALVVRTIGAGTRKTGPRPGVLRGLLDGGAQMLRSPDLLLVTFANMMGGVTFTGTIGTFLPLYGRELLISQTTIGLMFGIRSWVSALGRIPASQAVRRIGNHQYLLLGLIAESLCMFLLWRANGKTAIFILLACEGLAYAGFMVAGQTYLASRTTVANRGTVGGIHAMLASLGATFSPFAFGLVAERWGVRAVFAASSITMGAGAVLFAASFLWIRARIPGLGESEHETPRPPRGQERSLPIIASRASNQAPP
jgi:MFS family permease